jgi:hypothetical protein
MHNLNHFTSDTPPNDPADRAEQAGFIAGMALLNMMQTANLEPTACLELLALALLDEQGLPDAAAPDYQHARGLAAALYPVLCRGLEADRAYETELLLRRAVERGGYMTNTDLIEARELLRTINESNQD